MITHVTPSLIEVGHYYLKKGHENWLRQTLGLNHLGQMVYVDFTGLGACDLATLSRWASLGFTVEEAAVRFPKEVAAIEKAKAAAKARAG
jgi:hypothetical protein